MLPRLAFHSRNRDLERTEVDEGHGYERSEPNDEADPRADIYVRRWLLGKDLPCRPGVLVRVVAIKRRRAGGRSSNCGWSSYQ